MLTLTKSLSFVEDNADHRDQLDCLSKPFATQIINIQKGKDR